jgi:riboflavin synthase
LLEREAIFMFTGIIQTQATVVSRTHTQGVLRLVVSVNEQYVKHLDLGASIAIYKWLLLNGS